MTKPITTAGLQGADVVHPATGEKWVYSDIVRDHFFNPRNLLLDEPKEGDYDAIGLVGSAACGDTMKIWLKVEKATEQVKDMKWKTFGCGSAIAATSMYSVMITENEGLTLDAALKITPRDIMERLGGLPTRKVHCSVLADKAFQKAVNNYFRATSQHSRIIVEGSKVIDPVLNITDHDIEEAVLEGATTLEEVQKKLKVGVGSPEAIPAIEQLIRFYQEKYYG